MRTTRPFYTIETSAAWTTAISPLWFVYQFLTSWLYYDHNKKNCNRTLKNASWKLQELLRREDSHDVLSASSEPFTASVRVHPWRSNQLSMVPPRVARCPCTSLLLYRRRRTRERRGVGLLVWRLQRFATGNKCSGSMVTLLGSFFTSCYILRMHHPAMMMDLAEKSPGRMLTTCTLRKLGERAEAGIAAGYVFVLFFTLVTFYSFYSIVRA